MRNMYDNRIARGDGLTFLRVKRRESAMAASSDFKGSCDYCYKSGHKKGQLLQISARIWHGNTPSSGGA